MARFNEILVGRYNRLLQKIFQIKSTAPTPILGTEITPGFQLFTGVENRYLEGWLRFGSSVRLAAVVAQLDSVRFRNPTASNVVAIIEKLLITNVDVAQQMLLTFGPIATDLASAISVIRLDARAPSLLGGSSCSLSFATGAGLLTSFIGQPQLPLATNLDWILDDDQEITILPGDALQLSANTVNSTIGLSIIWRERFLEESERT